MSATHLDRGDGRPACGAPGAVSPAITADTSAVDCVRCNGGGWTWPDVRPHGTVAAYRRHYRHGEEPCESCRQAKARAQADYRDRRKRAAA